MQKLGSFFLQPVPIERAVGNCELGFWDHDSCVMIFSNLLMEWTQEFLAPVITH
jgi:hypothetical protein